MGGIKIELKQYEKDWGCKSMPNQLELELTAIHSTIAEIKRQMNDCVNVKHYEALQKKLNEFEEMRLELLKAMAVEL